MNRCACLLVALAAAALAPLAASAQDGAVPTRTFPREALRGTVLFGTPPAIQLNGDATLMAAGYRVHGPDNLIVMSAQLVGLKATVDYTTDMQGQVREVWLLTPAESARRWPSTPDEAATWSFDPATQAWTKP